MYFFGRGISAFFNQLFRWLFWNKTGQKLLFSVLIVFIFFCFIKLGEVSAVEEVQDVNYEVQRYYDGVINDAIVRLSQKYFAGQNATFFTQYFKNNNSSYKFYFYYGNAVNGSQYNGSVPLSTRNLRIAIYNNLNANNLTWTPTSSDYSGVTGYTMYQISDGGNNFAGLIFEGSNFYSINSFSTLYAPMQLFNYTSENWINFMNYIRDDNQSAIRELLEDIKESNANIEDALTNTTPTSETDSFVDVDSSSVDDLSSASVDNVFSTMTTGFANKFTNYDLSTVNSFVWNLNGTRITFYSDTLYKMIQGTFFETLLSMLWYYIFGHYAFVWLSNIIHKIKDGSILDGLEVNEVITKEML